MKIKVTTETDVDIDLDLLAKCFAHLDDDSQAQFFVKVAAIAAKDYEAPPETQWWYVGRHLRTCECSTEDGREVIRSIYHAMEHKDAQS